MEPLLHSITTVMAVLQAGIELRNQMRTEHEVAFHLAARSFGFGDGTEGKGLYAEVTVTNKSDQAYTVGGFRLEMAGEDVQPVEMESEPVEEILDDSAAGTMPRVITSQDAYYFENVKLWRARGFPDMAYLEPGQAGAGVVVFHLPQQLGAISSARLRLVVSGYDYDVVEELL